MIILALIALLWFQSPEAPQTSFGFGAALAHAHPAAGQFVVTGVFCGRKLVSDPANTTGHHFYGNAICVDSGEGPRWFWYDWPADPSASRKISSWATKIVVITLRVADPECLLALSAEEGSPAPSLTSQVSGAGVYRGTATLTATITSGGAPLVEKPISFTLNGNPVGTGVTNRDGVANISNVSLSGINAGTYAGVVGASFAGDTVNAASSGAGPLNVGRADQTITFGALAQKTFGDPDFALSATASSGFAVSFSAAGNCALNGGSVRLTGAGSCTITASQAGTADYNAASELQRSFQIAKAATTTAVASSSNPSAVGQPATFTATVTSAAGTPTGLIQFKVGNVNLGAPVALGPGGTASVSTVDLAAGQHAVTALYGGDANFAAGSGSLPDGGQWALSLSVAHSSRSEGNEPGELDFLVSISPACPLPVLVNYTTVDGTAVAPSDYEAKSGTLSFSPGETSRRLGVRINGDTEYEESEELFIDVSLPGGAAAARGRGLILNDDPTGGILEFELPTYNVAEGGSLTLKVRRAVWSNLPVEVDYTTDDGGVAAPCSATTGLALDRCDYTKALGTLRFAPGETEKTITLLTGQDSYFEGAETFKLKLSNPRGNAAIGPKSVATINIEDDSPETHGNASDDVDNFVRQHYLDFLNREPDPSGLRFWREGITDCGADAVCREVKRVDTSAAFFLSIEFQETGYFVYRMYKAAFGDATSPNVPDTVPVIRLNEFLPDTQQLGQGVRVGIDDWRAQLESNKQAYALESVGRQRFLNAFPLSLTAAEFVERLNRNAGGVLTRSEQEQLVAQLTSATDPAAARASALRQVAENPSLRQREFMRAFVLMQFYGYLRRDPDAVPDADFRGWKFWLDKLEQFGGDYRRAEMVRAFLDSAEYRRRFGL